VKQLQETIVVADFERRFTPKLQRRIRSMGYHADPGGLDKLGFKKDDYVSYMRRSTHSGRIAGLFGWHRLGGTLNMTGARLSHLLGQVRQDHPDCLPPADGSRANRQP